LHNADLAPALEWLKNWMQKNQGLKVELAIAGQVAFEKEEARILLFESIRELLFNVVKHANADTAYVGIDGLDGKFRIEIRDEGCGFDSSEIGGETENAGLGLISVRERLSLLGGSMNIETAPGKGSRVSLVVPAQ
jgi:signal transduction histidine kinase